MSLTETLEALDELLPTGDGLLFTQPSPVQSIHDRENQDAFTSLDLPDFVNFSMDDVTFGDLEFLDLATLPLERSKNKNPTMGAYPDIYFNSIATPSGYCSTNFLTEEHNRLTLLLSDSDANNDRATTFGDDLETVGKGILDNLFDNTTGPHKNDKRCTIDEQLPDVLDKDAKAMLNDDVVYEVPMEVLSLMAKNFESLQEDFENTSDNTDRIVDGGRDTTAESTAVGSDDVAKDENVAGAGVDKSDDRAAKGRGEYRTVTIKSIHQTTDASPPPGTVAKILILRRATKNTTLITISSLDGTEGHSFEINTSNLMRATNALRSLNLDSMSVLRKILRLGPVASTRVVKTAPEDHDVIEFETVGESSEAGQCEQQGGDANGFEPDPGDPQEMIKRITSVRDIPLQRALAEYGINVKRFVCVITAAGKKYWVCPDTHCRKAFGKCYLLKLHILAHFNVRPFKCEEPGCNWAFYTMTKLKRHKESHLKKKSFTCKVEGCDKKFSTVYNLNTHLNIHNREAQFFCPHPKCPQAFQNQRSLDNHLCNNHTGEVEPSCRCPVEGCDKGFFSVMKLKGHMKSHKISTPLRCSYHGCEKVFDKPCRLKAHEVFHTGEKPFGCDFPGCQWRFPTSSKLSRHKRSHNNDRKYECRVMNCKRMFIRAEHLKDHEQSVHSGKRNFNCPVDGCDKTFSLKSAIYKHVQKTHAMQHNTIRVVFKCPVPECSKRYVSKTAFRSHISKYHQEEFLATNTVVSQESPANQLDFIALLSSVGENLCSEVDPGLLHLVEVDLPSAAEVEAVPQCTVTLPGLDPLPISQLGQISLVDSALGGVAISEAELGSVGDMVCVPLEGELIGSPSSMMSDGLVTVDTSAISPRKSEAGRKRKLATTMDGKCARKKGDEEQLEDEGGGLLAGVVLDTVGEEKLYQDLIRLPNGDTMEIMGNIVEEGRRPEGDGATEVPVGWQQDWEKEDGDQVVEFPESTSTINLRDLE